MYLYTYIILKVNFFKNIIEPIDWFSLDRSFTNIIFGAKNYNKSRFQ